MESYNPWAKEKQTFLILGTCDPKFILSMLQRGKVEVWNDQIKGYDVINRQDDIVNCSFENGKYEFDNELAVYSGTRYGVGVVIGVELNENVLENKTLKQVREQAVQIMREHGAFVMPNDLSIMYGECSQ